MFEVFSRNYIHPDQDVEKWTLSKFENMQDGFALWYARRVSWPLQKIAFDVTVSTPRKLCCLEDIILYIYQVMPDNPPDSESIALELAIHESAFVDKIITDLITLRALKTDSTGRIKITDLGCEYFSRGQIPSTSRTQKISLCFDPVAHEFPDNPVFSNGDLDCDENAALHPIVADVNFAEPNRIDLDTIRRVATSQKLLCDNDAMIFDAKPTEADDDKQSTPDIGYRDVVVLVFLNDHGQVSLRISDPKSKTAAGWFQAVLDSRLKKKLIDSLLGSLTADGNTKTATDTNGRIQINGDSISLTLIPAYSVQETIITAVNGAKNDLYIQALHPIGCNGHTAPLIEAVKSAAERGVRCHLLWDGTMINGNTPIHDGIQHRLGSSIGGEFLIAGNITLAASVTEMTLPVDGSTVRIMTVGKSKSSSACRKLREKFLSEWESAEPFDPAETATDPELISQDSQNRRTNKAAARAV